MLRVKRTVNPAPLAANRRAAPSAIRSLQLPLQAALSSVEGLRKGEQAPHDGFEFFTHSKPKKNEEEQASKKNLRKK